MSHQITIIISDEVFQGLQTVADGRTISEVIEDLARTSIGDAALENSYKEMSLDCDRECEAAEWIEGLIQDPLPGSQRAPR